MAVDVLANAIEKVPTSIDAPSTGEPRTAGSVATGHQGLASALFWALRRIQDMLGQWCPIGSKTPVSATVDTGANTLTIVAHGLADNDPVMLFQRSDELTAMPGGLASYTRYYVVNKTDDTFKLATTAGGSAIDITTAGTGDLYAVLLDASLLRAGVLETDQLRVLGGAFLYSTLSVVGQASFTGVVARLGTAAWEVVQTYQLPDADNASFPASRAGVIAVPDTSSNREIVLAAHTYTGQVSARFVRTSASNVGGFAFKRPGTPNVSLATLPGSSGFSSVQFAAFDNGDSEGVQWHTIDPGGDANVFD